MTLTYRGNGAWGTGKGARLTAAEFDGNTYEFDTRLDALEAGSGSGADNPVVDVQFPSGSTALLYFADGSTETRTVSAVPFAAPVRTITGTTYTVSESHIGYYARCTNASGCVVTVPVGLTNTGAEWHFRQGAGAGPISFVEEASGVTINPVEGFDLATDKEGATVTLKNVDNDEYDIFGLLAVTP